MYESILFTTLFLELESYQNGLPVRNRNSMILMLYEIHCVSVLNSSLL